MRRRTVGGALWVAVVALACLVQGSLAHGSPAPAGGALADREDLEIVVQPREPRPDVFVLKGRVQPVDPEREYADKPAILQRRNCGSCGWFGFDRFRTDDRGRFRLRVPTPGPEVRKRICYRIKVARSDRYRRALSASSCIGAVGTGG